MEITKREMTEQNRANGLGKNDFLRTISYLRVPIDAFLFGRRSVTLGQQRHGHDPRGWEKSAEVMLSPDRVLDAWRSRSGLRQCLPD